MMDLLKLIMGKRTIRQYKQEQLKSDEIEAILSAGLWASSAGGVQSPIMLVCKNAAINDRLGRINRKLFVGVHSEGIHSVSNTQRSIADDGSIKSGFYNAPIVITLFVPEEWVYGVQDCSMAAESMAIMAWSRGIGSCYVSRAEETFQSEFGKKIMQDAGIALNYIARVCLCLGYPDGEFGQGKPRKDNRVFFVEK